MKKLIIISIFATLGLVAGCGSVVTQQDIDAEAIRQEKRLEESIDHIEEDYKGYVEDMGIDVDSVLQDSE